MPNKRTSGERELGLLIALEGIIASLMSKKIGGHRARYAFLKDPLLRARRERIVLEEALNGNVEAKRLRAQGVHRDSHAMGQ